MIPAACFPSLCTCAGAGTLTFCFLESAQFSLSRVGARSGRAGGRCSGWSEGECRSRKTAARPARWPVQASNRAFAGAVGFAADERAPAAGRAVHPRGDGDGEGAPSRRRESTVRPAQRGRAGGTVTVRAVCEQRLGGEGRRGKALRARRAEGRALTSSQRGAQWCGDASPSALHTRQRWRIIEASLPWEKAKRRAEQMRGTSCEAARLHSAVSAQHPAERLEGANEDAPTATGSRERGTRS